MPYVPSLVMKTLWPLTLPLTPRSILGALRFKVISPRRPRLGNKCFEPSKLSKSIVSRYTRNSPITTSSEGPTASLV
jgi:hypothetical protein